MIWEIPRKFRREHSSLERGPRLRLKGGGGTNTTTTQSGPPPDVLAHYNQVYEQAKNVAGQPNQQYNAPLIAGFTPMQTAGFENINTAANAGEPFLNQASDYITNAATGLDPSHFGGTVSAYQSPYTQRVVDATQAQFNNQNQIQDNQLRGNAASAGAFGGDREAVARAVLAGQQQANQAPTIANLYNTGFQNATNAAQANAWLNSQAGFGMANLGQEAQALGLSGANAQLQAGAQQQRQGQQELNLPYQSWLAAQGYPFQITNWLEGMATGTGGASGGVGSTTSPGPSPVSQIAGLGLTGVGALGQSGAFGRNGWLTGVSNPATTSGAEFSSLNDTWAARGGRIGGFASGGGIDLPDLSINYVPVGGASGSAGLLGPGGSLLRPTGTTSTSDSTGGDSEIGSLIKTAGLIAAGIYGGPAGAAAGSAFNSQVHFDRGGGIEDFARRHRVAGMAPVPVTPRGFDIGGAVTPGLSASVSGNPMQAQLQQTYAGLPTEQLREMAARFPPSTPQGMMVQRALRARMMNPGSDPSRSTVPQGGMGMSQMFEGGGEVDVDQAADEYRKRAGPWYQRNKTIQSGRADVDYDMAIDPTPATGDRFEMRQLPSKNERDYAGKHLSLADGGEADDDFSELVIPQAGPSVPGGLSAGLSSGMGSVAPTISRGKLPTSRHGDYVPPPPDLAPVVLAAAERHGVDPKPLAWLLSTESQWNPKAYNPASGTIGIGQFKPATAKEVGIDPWNPHQAIDGSAAYLRKMLDRNNGDYERAIARYGTFSTGHGAEADAAVRARFRRFMGTPNAARGGQIGGFADGGEPNDIEPMTPSEDLPAPPIPPASGMARVSPSKVLVNDGGGGTILPPPIPPAERTPTAGFGSVKPEALEEEALKPNPWEALLAAGLGIMGGSSPHAAVNIGQGGMAGLTNYQKQRQLMIQDQIRRDTAKTNAVWRAGQLGNMQDKTRLQSAIAETREPLVAAQTDLAKARADAIQARAETGSQKYTYQATTAPDPDDPSKTVSGFVKLDPSGKESPQFIRTDTNPNKPGSGAGMGSRAEVYFNRVVSAGNEAAAAAANIMELPTSASRGIFGGRSQGPGLLAAAKETLTNSLTSQEVQDYNSMIAGVARNLSTIEASGLAPSGALTHSMEAVVLKEGDSEITKMRKMAEMRQIVEKGLEPNLANPRIPPEQKQAVRDIISSMSKAIPFTHHDITMLQRSKDPKITMADLVKSKGLSSEPSQPVASKAAPSSTSVPVWVKPGDEYSPSLRKARDASGNVYGAP